jgi:hypothetical protein
MRRTTVMLSDELDARLRFEARRRGGSVAELIREALDARFRQPSGRRELSFAAVAEGDEENVSERVDEFVGRAIQRRKLPTATPTATESESNHAPQGSNSPRVTGFTTHRTNRPVRGSRLHLGFQKGSGRGYLVFVKTFIKVASGFTTPEQVRFYLQSSGGRLETIGRVPRGPYGPTFNVEGLLPEAPARRGSGRSRRRPGSQGLPTT